MGEPVASRADAAKVAPSVGQGDVVATVQRRLGQGAAEAAGDAGDQPVCPGWLLGGWAARLQKGRKCQTFEHDGTLSVDWFEALLLPVADRIAMAIEELRRVIDRVGSMDLGPPGIGSAPAQAPTQVRSEVDFCGAPMRDCAQASRSPGA